MNGHQRSTRKRSRAVPSCPHGFPAPQITASRSHDPSRESFPALLSACELIPSSDGVMLVSQSGASIDLEIDHPLQGSRVPSWFLSSWLSSGVSRLQVIRRRHRMSLQYTTELLTGLKRGRTHNSLSLVMDVKQTIEGLVHRDLIRDCGFVPILQVVSAANVPVTTRSLSRRRSAKGRNAKRNLGIACLARVGRWCENLIGTVIRDSR